MQLPDTVIHRLIEGTQITLGDIPVAAQAYLLCALTQSTDKPVVHIVPQDKDMEAIAALCRFLTPERTILTLPAWDTLPYDRISPSPAITAARITTLAQLASQTGRAPYILLTTVNAATQKLPPRSLFAQAHFQIAKGKRLDRDKLLAFLTGNGYSRVGKVMEAGEYAARGSLIDLFAPGEDYAVRIDLFGDEIESLRRFDPLTQLSDAPVEQFELRPVNEVLLKPSLASAPAI